MSYLDRSALGVSFIRHVGFMAWYISSPVGRLVCESPERCGEVVWAGM